MTARICFIDTETTSLRHDRRAWEIGIIARDEAGADTEHQWFVDVSDLDLGNADLMSLKIGRFFERHDMGGATIDGQVMSERNSAARVESLTRGAHLVGAVVSFDADVLGQRMRANGICPSWHYHLIDVEALAVGYLARWNKGCTDDTGQPLWQPPWKSDNLSAALGITVSDEDRHTALGDARWAKAIYDKVMGGAS